MNIDEIRLELLKLTYTHAREASEAVVRAKVLEAYILKPLKKQKAEKPPG